MLTGNTEEELRQQKIRLLETVIENQNKILEEELDEVPLKLFIPYKEVLGYMTKVSACRRSLP